MQVVMDEIQALLHLDDVLDVVDPDSLDRLESVIQECNSRMNEGDPVVPDSIYDRLVSILRKYRPQSGVFSELWEEDGDITEYSSILSKHPMMSILTVKSWDSPDLSDFLGVFDQDSSESFHLSYKIDGHGIRVVYQDGNLVLATSRARASAGRDLTRQMKVILGEFNPDLAGFGLVEVRGEIALHHDRLEDARSFTPNLKSAFSAVSSLIKPSSTPEENALLSFLAYKILSDNDDLMFDTKSDEYEFLETHGFQTPGYTSIELSDWDNAIQEINTSVQAFEEDLNDFGFLCDGVVIEVESREDFDILGSEGNHMRGNLALKVNSWAQDLYYGRILRIDWKPGKSRMSPVAVIEPTVTNQGNSVQNVPLYTPANILNLKAYPDNFIHFRYGGETGVVPCYEDGSLLNDDTIRELVETPRSNYPSEDEFE